MTEGRKEGPGPLPGKGPPPLTPFGLKLHHDGVFSHEGQPIGNRRLREHFDRSVEYLAEEAKYIVRLKHFRGEIVVQEAAFFVRAVDLEKGEVHLSDGSREALDLATLAESPIDGALLCRIKRDVVKEGLLARFMHSAQSELLQAVELHGDQLCIEIGGRRESMPEPAVLA